MRECKIYIKAAVTADGYSKTDIAASGYPYDVVTALADVLICVVKQTKKDDATVDRVVYRAVGTALEQQKNTKVTGTIQTVYVDLEDTP